jgi:CrcB protein
MLRAIEEIAMGEWISVAVGGAVGSVLRYGTGIAVARALGGAFPWGTLVVNVLGSILIGWFASATLPQGNLAAHNDMRILVMTGFCGGFTTFSAFSLQTLGLLQEGAIIAALANIALSVGLCLAAVAAGWMIGERAWIFG